MDNQEPIIELIGLGKVYDNKNVMVRALENINLTIYEGEIFGIIGLSGAGKSTLVRCINYLERPTEGKVIFNGIDLSTVSEKELLKIRQSMGMIFQQFNLLMQRTALQNICFPMEIAGVPKKEAKKRAYELLEIVGLGDKAKAYPAQLSGGQKQELP
jgi:ABC transporter.